MINFNKFFKLFNLISLCLVIMSILLLFFKGLNFGVDFKGGTLIELRALNSIKVPPLKSTPKLSPLKNNNRIDIITRHNEIRLNSLKNLLKLII